MLPFMILDTLYTNPLIAKITPLTISRDDDACWSFQGWRIEEPAQLKLARHVGRRLSRRAELTDVVMKIKMENCEKKVGL